MSLATLHPNLRSAFRERLLTLVDVDHSPGVSVSLASGVFTRASGSWLTAGFAPGMEVTVSSFTGSPLYGVVDTVSALALKLGVSGSQTVAGGGRFVVALPGKRENTNDTNRHRIAFEGADFFPVDGFPYVAESVRAGSSSLRPIANPSGVGLAEHALEATATLFYPKRGTLAIERMAGALMTLLAESPRRLAYGGVSSLVRNVERSALYQDGDRIACAVTASLLAFTTS